MRNKTGLGHFEKEVSRLQSGMGVGAAVWLSSREEHLFCLGFDDYRHRGGRLGHKLGGTPLIRVHLRFDNREPRAGLEDRRLAPEYITFGSSEKVDLELHSKNHFPCLGERGRCSPCCMISHRGLDARMNISVLLQMMRRYGELSLAFPWADRDQGNPKTRYERNRVEYLLLLLTR